MLKEISTPTQGRKLRVMQGDNLLYETDVDEDAVVAWSPDRDLLYIPE